MSSFAPHFPDLPCASTVRSKVDPLAVVGPTRIDVVGSLIGQPMWWSTVGSDHKDRGAFTKNRIENDLLCVGRPARIYRRPSIPQLGQSQQIGAIGVASINLPVSRAIGDENDLLALRRAICGTIKSF